MATKYRYPGAQPFQTHEEHIFFGRATDVEELYQQVTLESLVVLHAKSGLGKSSLINAGLLPKVAVAGEFSPYSIRFYADSETNTFTPLARSLEVLESRSALLDKIRPAGDNSLWYHLKSQQLALGATGGILLTFDQFEELFTYSETAVAQFAQQLSEALYVTLPQRYREERRRGFANNPDFLTSEELELLDQPLNLRVLTAIRSDRMSLLKQLKDWLPNILSADYELRPLNREQAEDAILTPAYQRNGFTTPVFDYSEPAIEFLLNFLSENGTEAIESFQLQILCEYVERQVVLKQQKTLVEKSDLYNPNEILENYYLDKIAAIADEKDRLAARRFIEEGLIFEEEERRLTVYEGQVRRTYGISAELLRQLLDTHLIRSEPSLRGGYTYELSHDTLVVPVLKAKGKRKEEERIKRVAMEKEQREQELAALQVQADQERELREVAEENEKKAKQQRRLSFVFLGIALITALITWYQWREALIQQEEALLQTEIATLALQDFQRAEQNRLSLEIRQLLVEMETLQASEDFDLAQEKRDSAWVRLRQAMQLDSTRTEILELKKILQ